MIDREFFRELCGEVFGGLDECYGLESYGLRFEVPLHSDLYGDHHYLAFKYGVDGLSFYVSFSVAIFEVMFGEVFDVGDAVGFVGLNRFRSLRFNLFNAVIVDLCHPDSISECREFVRRVMSFVRGEFDD